MPRVPADGVWFPPEEFAARRARVFDAIGPDACAVLQGAGPVLGFQDFRQSNDFFYLSGVEMPQAYLLLDGRTRQTSLYLPPRDPHANSEGRSLGAEDSDEVRRQTGVEAVFSWGDLADHIADRAKVYICFNPPEERAGSRDTLLHAARCGALDPWDGGESRRDRFQKRLAERLPSLAFEDLNVIVDDLRLIKSPRELEVMRWTGLLSARAVTQAMEATRPGAREYELWAIADYVFRVNGARREGYRPIIPTGANIWYSHYYRNDAALTPGDLVLMDCAPDVGYYTSDIGRMWPVDGRYQPWQRELYGFMVRYHKAILRRMRPGILPREVLAGAADEMEGVIRTEGFSTPAFEAAARRCLEFTGHLSHPVGMAVHDVGSYFERPMEPGLVITVDPQMWVPEDHLYIRVEDTVAITDDGTEILTGDAPLDLDDVEEIVGRGGMLHAFPPLNGTTNGAPRKTTT